jgi:GNAT superfamily N-acetyltransferase
MSIGMASENFVFADASELGVEVFDRFYNEILAPSFPPEELEAIDVVREIHNGPGAVVPGVVALRGGDPVGGALGESYERSRVVLLCYLAVRDDTRGTGLGAALLDRALPAWRRAFTPTAILAEVEDPRVRQAGPHGDPVARLRFYDRAGGKLLPIPYTQPSVGQGQPRVPEMFLISLDPGLESIPRATVLDFLDEYLESMDGSTDDPEHRALRAAIESRSAEIPLWPLSRLAEMP